MLVSVLVMASPVFAAVETGETLPVEPGITPDSPMYGLDKVGEKLQLAFAFREQRKAELHYRFAQERLSEAEQLVEDNETDLIEETMEDYEEELNETENEIEKAVARGQNVTELIEHVTSMTAKHLAVLQKVYDKVPEQAKASIQHAMEVSVRKQVGVLAHVEDGEEIKERVRQEVENQIAGDDSQIKEKINESLQQGLNKPEDSENETEDLSKGNGKQ
jgi:hypothetical protein